MKEYLKNTEKDIENYNKYIAFCWYIFFGLTTTLIILMSKLAFL